MQPLLPEKESGNGTGATCLAQAKYLGNAYTIFLRQTLHIPHRQALPAFP